jgi:predicted ATPase
VEETQDRWALPETLRLRGDVLLAMSDTAAAEASYGEALALARQQGAKLWELFTAMSLARVWHDQGKPISDKAILSPVRFAQIFTHRAAGNALSGQAVLKSEVRGSANLRKTGDRYDQKIGSWYGFGIGIGDRWRCPRFWSRC